MDENTPAPLPPNPSEATPAAPAPPQPAETTPTPVPTEKKEEPSSSPQVDKELIADLTVGLPSPFRLLQEAVALFKQKWLLFGIILALPLLANFLLGKSLDYVIQQNALPSFVISFLGVLYPLVAVLLFSLGQLALLFAIKENDNNITIIHAYGLAEKYFLGYWKILLLICSLTVLGFFFFLIPGVILAIWFTMALFVFVAEDLTGVNALMQSKGYVQGFWSAICIRLIIVAFVVSLFFLPALIALLLNIPLAFELLQGVGLMLALPILSIFGFLIYGNLRIIKNSNAALVEALKATKSSKAKLKILLPTLFQGAFLGVPLVLYLLFLFVIRPFILQGDSMFPTLQHNAFIIANVMAYNSSAPKRGDIVIIRLPTDPSVNIVKRIVGLPREKVSIMNGSLYINEKKLEEQYIPSTLKTLSGSFLQERYAVVIPKGHYVVLGDNRADSNDSREWGFIRSSDIIGEASDCLFNCPKKPTKK